MIRKSLFWGLTLVLVVVIVNLILRGRQTEKQQSSNPAEVVQQAKPTSTRVLAPQDLEIASSTMRPEGPNTARHSVRIRNNGSLAYSRVQLRFVYADRNDKNLATKDYPLARTLKPGESVDVSDIVMTGVPSAAMKCQVSILYADL